MLAAGGGVVCDVGFPGIGWWVFSIVGMAMLVLALSRDSARWNTVVGLVFGLAFFLPHIQWINTAVGLVPWLALSLAQSGFVALACLAWSWARRGAVIWSRLRYQVPVFAVIWVGLEEARSVMPFGGFPWGRLAFAHADSPLGRWAWLGGAPLVSLSVAALGVLLAAAVVALRRFQVGRASGQLLLGVVVVLVPVFLPISTAAEQGRLQVAAVQGNVPDRGLDSLSQAREVLANHAAGTHALTDRVEPGELDVVLWPENSADFDPRTDAAARILVSGAARALDAPVLVGTIEFPSSGGRYNVALLWDPELGPVDHYYKQQPAAFAEYMPMREIARMFSPAVDRVRTDMLAGEEVALLGLDVPRMDRTVGLASVICFEVAYDGIVRESIAAGGEVFVVQTNNATFGRTDESTQQLAMSQLRAIEHGRAAVQISTVGVSGVITPDGVVRQRTELFTPDAMVASLGLRSSLTPATRIGDEVAWGLRALAVLTTLAGMAGARRVRRDERPVGAW